MGFIDWLLGDPDYLNIGRRERVSGTPRAAGRRQSRNIWGDATEGAREIKQRWDNRGQDPNRSTGRWINNSRSIDFGTRGRSADSSVDDILAMLESLQDPSRYLDGGSDYSEMARAAASAQYDPIIAALEGQMASASSRANRNKTELGNMFSALSSNLQADIPQIQQQYAGDKSQTKQQ